MKKYIYGAGKFGKLLYTYFMSVNVKIDGFIETQKGNIDTLYGLKIIEYKELVNEKDKLNIYISINNNDAVKEIKKMISDSRLNVQVFECAGFIKENLQKDNKPNYKEINNVRSAKIVTNGIQEKVSFNFRAISDMDRLIREKISLIPNDVDLIVGVPRSGMLPATIIALLLNKPLLDINLVNKNKHNVFNNMSRRVNDYDYNLDSYKKILVVEDSCNTGESIAKAKNSLIDYCDKIEILYCCIYATEHSKHYVDIFFEEVNIPRFFEWNILNHSALKYACCDLDGVLCVDPTAEENDDGENYKRFLLNARPLFIPKTKIKYIVTSRLEKYRNETEIWLKKNGVMYDELIMLNLNSKEERIRLKMHSKFKIEIYRKLDAIIFLESDLKQALEIYNATNKDVYCVGSNEYYHKKMNLYFYLCVRKKMDDIKKCINELFSLKSCGADIIYENELSGIYESIVSVLEQYNIYYDINALNIYFEELKYMMLNKSIWGSKELFEIDLKLECFISGCLRALSTNISEFEWKAEQEHVYSTILQNCIENCDEEFLEEKLYIRNKGYLQLYPYEFSENYDKDTINIVWDEELNSKYVLHKGHKLFWPDWEDEKIKNNYNQLLMEQSEESPHQYYSEKIAVEDGDIFVDIGAAEGMVSLDIVEKAKEVFIIEASDEWVTSLKNTFHDYMYKIHIIKKYAGYKCDNETISIDDLLSDYSSENIFLKLDVEGMELEVLGGMINTLSNNQCKVSCATYHYDDEFSEVKRFFDIFDYDTEVSDGYMPFYFGKQTMLNGKYRQINKPYFRKVIVRGKKKND